MKLKEQKSDEEIKKCIKACSDDDCENCSYTSPEKGNATCTNLLLKDALKLINKHERRIVDTTTEYSEKLIKLAGRLSK